MLIVEPHPQEFLIQEVWGGARKSACLISSQICLFPIAAVTYQYKPSGLKPQKFIVI